MPFFLLEKIIKKLSAPTSLVNVRSLLEDHARIKNPPTAVNALQNKNLLLIINAALFFLGIE